MNPVVDLNRLALEFSNSDKTRVELRPVANHNCWGDPSKALFRGAAEGDISLVRAALCSGMDPDTFFKGQTPLMFAAEKGHAAACLLLIANGANVNLLDKYRRSALHYATRNQHVACTAALMDGGAKNNIECDLGGETPSDFVRLSGNSKLIRVVNFYSQNIDEIRNELLSDAKLRLREFEALAVSAVQPPDPKKTKKVDLSAEILKSSSDSEEEL